MLISAKLNLGMLLHVLFQLCLPQPFELDNIGIIHSIDFFLCPPFLMQCDRF